MEQELIFSLDTFYELKKDGSPVTLDVLIGDEGQSPDFTVRLNTKKLLEHSKESIKDFLVGNDKDIVTKKLRIIGNVTDVSKESNKIEITLKVKGGVEEFKKKFTVTVDQEGELVIFSFVVRFFV